MRARATERIKKMSDYNEKYVNEKRKKAKEYTEGDLVVVKNFETGSKLAPAYRGPYRVVRKLRNDRYVIVDVEECQISQRPYQETWEANNMKPWREKPKSSDSAESSVETDSEQNDD